MRLASAVTFLRAAPAWRWYRASAFSLPRSCTLCTHGTGGPPTTFTRAHLFRFGMDCVDKVEWRGWSPGGEYHKTFTIKNVTTRMVKFKYRLPQSKYFSMGFPEPIQLLPGMSCPIRVTFRPVKMEPYSDVVQINTAEAAFHIKIIALTPVAKMEMPAQLDFGLAPVGEVCSLHMSISQAVPFDVISHICVSARYTCIAKEMCLQVQQREFHVTNIGDVPLSFSWKAPAPFTISPTSGNSLEPGSTSHYTASFTASDASVYSATAICALSNGMTNFVKVTAIGKFPFLALDRPAIEHGDVLVGQVVKATVRLLNHAQVPANFTVKHSAGRNDAVFAVSPTSGSILPGSWATLSLRYKPQFAGTFSSEEFDISTVGGNVVKLKQRGRAIGALVAASDRAINFGDVRMGQAVKRVCAKSCNKLFHADTAACL